MGNHLTHMPMPARFWAQVEKRGDAECWNWTGSRTQSGAGYGAIEIEGIRYQAHRYSFVMAHGAIPDGMVICHSCDNKTCVNPGHLFIGTQRDNMRDMASKGRHVGMAGKRKLFCKSGHRLEGDNVRISADGWRRCQACLKRNSARGAQRKKLKRAAARLSADQPPTQSAALT